MRTEFKSARAKAERFGSAPLLAIEATDVQIVFEVTVADRIDGLKITIAELFADSARSRTRELENFSIGI